MRRMLFLQLGVFCLGPTEQRVEGRFAGCRQYRSSYKLTLSVLPELLLESNHAWSIPARPVPSRWVAIPVLKVVLARASGIWVGLRGASTTNARLVGEYGGNLALRSPRAARTAILLQILLFLEVQGACKLLVHGELGLWSVTGSLTLTVFSSV